MKSEFITARIGQLAEHPAQMRTLYQIDDMAALTLQVYENDLDQWQPITATPDGKGGYYIISGHRRRMARLFAYGLSTWVSQPESPVGPETCVDIELVKQFISALVEKYEFVDAAAEVLTEHYATEEIEFVLFSGNAKDQILALQRANYGSVKPDMLGVAHSFQAALGAGATIAEVARNAGQTATYVRNHLALNKLPQELAEQIADGNLPMSIGVAVQGIKNEHKRHGLAWFVLSNPPSQLTAKAVKDVAKKLRLWNGLQVPLTTAHQAQRNIARSLTKLWHLVVLAYPVNSWGVIASFIYQGVNYQTPWEDQAAVDVWFKSIGGEHYYGEDGIKWDSVVTNLIDEVSCETCPVARLPERRLRSDLSPGQSGVIGMPCRHEANGPCLHGLAQADPFHVRVPWDWAQHESIERDTSGYVALSFDNLKSAWQAQGKLEGEEDNEAASVPQASASLASVSEVSASLASVPEASASLASVSEVSASLVSVPQEHVEATNTPQEHVEATDVPQEHVEAVIAPQEHVEVTNAPQEHVEAVIAPQEHVEATDALQEHVEATDAPQEHAEAALVPQANASLASVPEANPPVALVPAENTPSPIQKMRQMIAAYMSEHTSMNVDHPFATPCNKCQHKLTRSPVKDKTAPHCAWIGRLRELHFSQLLPMVGKAIPVCRQFAPKGTWAQLIPTHPKQANMSREWIKHQIETIVTRHAKNSRHFCEFLTGRPMKAGENYQHWFLDQLATFGPALSDEQLWTLMVWVLAESARLDIWSMSKWKKPDDSQFMIPASGANNYFIKVSEIEFISS